MSIKIVILTFLRRRELTYLCKDCSLPYYEKINEIVYHLHVLHKLILLISFLIYVKIIAHLSFINIYNKNK